MQTKKTKMKSTYSILITGTGPCGTGEKSSSADLLAQSLAQSLRENGHQVEHASIQTPDQTLLLHGELKSHPLPPEEKKGGGGQKKKGAAALPKPPDRPEESVGAPSASGEKEAEESLQESGADDVGAPPNTETNLAEDQA